MARLLGHDVTYGLGEAFRAQCLTGEGSLVWPSSKPWTVASVNELWAAFGEHPDASDRSFVDKLKDQLAGSSEQVLQITVDALAFYLLYPDKFWTSAKLDLLNTVLSWRSWDNPPDLTEVTAAYDEGGIG